MLSMKPFVFPQRELDFIKVQNSLFEIVVELIRITQNVYRANDFKIISNTVYAENRYPSVRAWFLNDVGLLEEFEDIFWTWDDCLAGFRKGRFPGGEVKGIVMSLLA